MKRILVATVLATFALGSAAMAQDASCETKAVGKDGKALLGAAKTSFMKKCMPNPARPRQSVPTARSWRRGQDLVHEEV